MHYEIQSTRSNELSARVQNKIDEKTKPMHALGRLESLALKVALIQQTDTPTLRYPILAVFAGDHGVTCENVSAYPSEVTTQMVFNFLAGGAAINVFARGSGLDVKVVDAGVNYDFGEIEGLIDAKIGMGTKNFALEAAMSVAECSRALKKSGALVDDWKQAGTNVIGFGEMGIGNTSSAAILTSLYADQPLAVCVGAGTGLGTNEVAAKCGVLTRALERTNLCKVAVDNDPWVGMREYGGFEIAMICGAMLRAAERRILILVDGYIATSAYLVARAVCPAISDYCVLTHQSAEAGHAVAFKTLKEIPLLDLGMCLGEGTGAAIAYPILKNAVAFLNEMASFKDAGISGQKT